MVFVEISLLCFRRWRVLWEWCCLLASVYQFSGEFFRVSQKGAQSIICKLPFRKAIFILLS